MLGWKKCHYKDVTTTARPPTNSTYLGLVRLPPEAVWLQDKAFNRLLLASTCCPTWLQETSQLT